MSADTYASRERLPALAFAISTLAGIGLAVVYVQGGQTQLEGLFLFVALGGIGVGMVLWAKRFMPAGPEIEDRGPLASTDDDLAVFAADFSIGEDEFARRGLLTKMFLGAMGALGLGLIFPIRSFGPSANSAFNETPWERGLRVVDENGQPIKRGGQPQTNGVLTVFPEGDLDDEFSQTLLIRLPGDSGFTPKEGREDWTADNLVAYSKVCTHAGCPVGLYEEESGLLLCPCHQSTFDVNEWARPVFGPAAVPLPQLPLKWNEDDELVADGDLSGPPGPGFWNQKALWEGDEAGGGG